MSFRGEEVAPSGTKTMIALTDTTEHTFAAAFAISFDQLSKAAARLMSSRAHPINLKCYLAAAARLLCGNLKKRSIIIISTSPLMISPIFGLITTRALNEHLILERDRKSQDSCGGGWTQCVQTAGRTPLPSSGVRRSVRPFIISSCAQVVIATTLKAECAGAKFHLAIWHAPTIRHLYFSSAERQLRESPFSFY